MIASGSIKNFELKAEKESNFVVELSPTELSTAQIDNFLDYLTEECGLVPQIRIPPSPHTSMNNHQLLFAEFSFPPPIRPTLLVGSWLADLRLSVDLYGQGITVWLPTLTPFSVAGG